MLSSPPVIDINPNLRQHNERANASPRTVQTRAEILKSRATKKGSAVTVPIFFRSKLFPAISHASPSILFDVIQSEHGGDHNEMSIHFSLYHMTYRYDPDSKWLERLQKILIDSNLDQTHRDEMPAPRQCDTATSLTRVRFGHASFAIPRN